MTRSFKASMPESPCGPTQTARCRQRSSGRYWRPRSRRPPPGASSSIPFWTSRTQRLKDTLAETCDHQPFISTAPVVLIFCADCLRWWDAYAEAGCDPRRPGPGDLMLAVNDAVIAAQNAVVAAESLGLGSCYIGDIMERYEEHRRLLGLPEWVFPACMLVMGYPTRQQRERKKAARFEQRFIVQENAYCRLEGTRLREMYRGHTGAQSFEDFLAAFCRRKYESDFSREMSRSVGQYLKDFQGEAEV